MTLPSLRRNFAWTLAGNAVYAACQWGMLVVLAKIGSTELVGRYALGLAVTAPVFLFFNFRLRAVQATDALGEYSFSAYRSVRVPSTLVALAVVAVIGYAAYGQAKGAIILLVGLAKSIESMSDLFYGLFQQRERLDLMAVSLGMRGVFSLVALWVLTRATGSLVLGLLGQVAVWLLVLLLFDAALGRRLADREARHARAGGGEIERLVRLAVPLGLVTTFGSLKVNVPRYFVEHHLGEGSLGIFAALAYVLTVGSLVINAVSLSAAPRLARHHAGGERADFGRIMARLLGVSVLLGVVGVAMARLWGRQILSLVYAADYAEHSGTLSLLMVAAALTYLSGSLQTGISAMRRFSVQLPIHLAGFLATLAGSALLVPRLGIRGGAWAVTAGAAVEVVLYASATAFARHSGGAGTVGWRPGTPEERA